MTMFKYGVICYQFCQGNHYEICFAYKLDQMLLSLLGQIIISAMTKWTAISVFSDAVHGKAYITRGDFAFYVSDVKGISNVCGIPWENT